LISQFIIPLNTVIKLTLFSTGLCL